MFSLSTFPDTGIALLKSLPLAKILQNKNASLNIDISRKEARPVGGEFRDFPTTPLPSPYSPGQEIQLMLQRFFPAEIFLGKMVENLTVQRMLAEPR